VTGYSVVGGAVVWRLGMASETRLVGARPGDFEALAYDYARSGRQIYCQGREMRGVDADSFRVLSRLYAVDVSRVYWYHSVLDGADVATFAMVGADRDQGFVRGFARDAHSVWHWEKTTGKPALLKGADPATFRALGHGYASDETQVWHERTRLVGADPRTFVLLGGMYSLYTADAQRVYYGTKVIVGCDRDSFEVLPSAAAPWGRDRQHWYCRQESSDIAAYHADLAGLSIFVGTVLSASVDNPAPEPPDLESEAQAMLRLEVRCDTWLQRPPSSVDVSVGQTVTLRRRFFTVDAAFWRGRTWIFFLSGSALHHNFEEWSPPDQQSRIEAIHRRTGDTV